MSSLDTNPDVEPALKKAKLNNSTEIARENHVSNTDSTTTEENEKDSQTTNPDEAPVTAASILSKQVEIKPKGGLPNDTRPTLTIPTPTEPPVGSGKVIEQYPVGSEEYKQQRKANHKEVERKRREAINNAIRELQELLPNPDSNKAQIIKKAAEYIKRLKENEASNIEKWTLEKLITDQAVNELANSNEKLKAELEKTYREIEHWKQSFFEQQREIDQLKKKIKENNKSQ